MNRKEYADRLMDAVGKISDRYINEAQNYRARKRMPGYLKAAIALAASLMLIFTASLPYLASVILNSGKGNSSAVSSESDSRVYDVLMNSSLQAYDTVPETDGAAIIWRYEDEYRIVPVSKTQTAELLSNAGVSKSVSEDKGLRIWIRTDDGLYMSPELKPSAGNTDCALFEYSPEIQINEKTAKAIIRILEENGK
jgi:hypothetical protein